MDALLKKAVKDISSGVGGAVIEGVSSALSTEEKKAMGVSAASKAGGANAKRGLTQTHANIASNIRSSSHSPKTIGIEEGKHYQVIDIENVYDGSNPNSKRGSKAVTYARSVYDKNGEQFGETEYYYVDYDGIDAIEGQISETAELIYRMVTDIDG